MSEQRAQVVSVASETLDDGGSLWTMRVAKLPANMRAAEAEPIAGDVPPEVLGALGAWSRP
jgi:hypothetical protein